MPIQEQNVQLILDSIGPSGAAVSIAATVLLTYRFCAFLVSSAMWFLRRRDLIKEGRPSEPPPSLPPSLGLVLLFVAGSVLAMTEPVAKLVAMHSSLPPIVVGGIFHEGSVGVAANGDAPSKKQPKDPPKKGCGVGCTGTYPNCRCTGQTEKQTKLSGIPTSILGEDCQQWSIEPLYTGPVNPPQS